MTADKNSKYGSRSYSGFGSARRCFLFFSIIFHLLCSSKYLTVIVIIIYICRNMMMRQRLVLQKWQNWSEAIIRKLIVKCDGNGDRKFVDRG